jgi:hypothetical protein
VLAHQGGWDELLLVLAPMAVIIVLLRLAKRRVDRQHPPAHQPGDRSDGGPGAR